MSWFAKEVLNKQTRFEQVDNKLKSASFLLEDIKEIQEEEISQTFEAISFSPPQFGKKNSRKQKDAHSVCDAFNTDKRFLQKELLKQQTELLTLTREIAQLVEDMVKENPAYAPAKRSNVQAQTKDDTVAAGAAGPPNQPAASLTDISTSIPCPCKETASKSLKRTIDENLKNLTVEKLNLLAKNVEAMAN